MARMREVCIGGHITEFFIVAQGHGEIGCISFQKNPVGEYG